MLVALWALIWWQGATELSSIRTIYIVPMSHLDIGFTAPPSQVATKMRQIAEQAIAFADADPDFVWTFETFWQLEQWLKSNPSETQRQKLLQLVSQGRFEVCAAYVNPHSNIMSAFLLDWLFRLPKRWADENSIPMRTAVLNDVPGHPIDLPHFLARNGIRYLLIGANLRFSPPLPTQIASTPFWWESPTGERVLTWIADRSYTEAFNELGVDPDSARVFNPRKFRDLDPMRVIAQGIEETIQRYRERGYPYDAIIALHAFDNWDAMAAGKLPKFVRMWNEQVGQPKLRLATPSQFFEHIERHYGDHLPVYRGGFGGQWESFVRPAIPTAMRRIRYAEQIAQTQTLPDLDLIRKLLVAYEHSFGMGVPWANMMTHEEAVQHNREQWLLLQSFPSSQDDQITVKWTSPPEIAAGELFSGALYLLPYHPLLIEPQVKDLLPLSEKVWIGWCKEVAEDGSVELHYLLDRRQLPADYVSIVWLWQLDDEQGRAKVVNKTATGWEVLPDDRLAGYDWGGWCSPFGFRFGKWSFSSDVVFAFRKVQWNGQPWLLGVCLVQRLTAVFKGNKKGTLTFDEAYPGEDTSVRFSIKIQRVF
ncbi:hypothetical protein HRbin17_00738 [bacterium HR17]|uniref:Glycoside hydrolase family 38 N-terminal domain-containing protein n=1 Tax=Candidatus Fervidibacter japonicus TaxID=2035412 RepID=A0A2H5XAM2_9BACT|nr:hypothetical protein HRbin17_00738 [bacterium HR17]